MANKIFVVYKDYDGYENTILFWTPDETVAKDFCDNKNGLKDKYLSDVKNRKAEYEKWKKEKKYRKTQIDQRGYDRTMCMLDRLMENKPDISKIPEDRHQKVLVPWHKKVDELNTQLDDMKLEIMRIIDGTNKKYNDEMDEEFDEKFPEPQRPQRNLDNDYVSYHYKGLTDEIPG